MGTITTSQYARMANAVYEIDHHESSESYIVQDFKTVLFSDPVGWGATKTAFKGCVYLHMAEREAVIAFQGTVPSKGGDVLADAQIVAGLMPQYSSCAFRLFKRLKETYPNHNVSLVGHSLGGAVAQIIGHWTGEPFVTFNAPGMWGHIQASKLVPPKISTDSARSRSGTSIGTALDKHRASTGRNFRNVFDPVSAYGSHYGPVTRFWGTGIHSMDDIERRIISSRWANLNPYDSRHREWGEL